MRIIGENSAGGHRTTESAESPPLCLPEHITADPKSSIHRNRGVVARALVGRLGGDPLTGSGLTVLNASPKIAPGYRPAHPKHQETGRW
jgi:hypothetical protein